MTAGGGWRRLGLLAILFIGGLALGRFSIKDAVAEKRMAEARKLAQAGDHVGAILKYESVVRGWANRDLRGEAQFQIGSSSIGLNQMERAMKEYEKVFQDFPASVRAEDAKFMIGLIFERYAGNVSAAREVYKGYLDMYPNGRRRREVELRISSLSEQIRKIPKSKKSP